MNQGLATQRKLVGRRRAEGIGLSLGSQILWGVAGNVGQFLFETTSITVAWLVGFRLILAGIILLAFAVWHDGWHETVRVWHNWHAASVLIIFSILAMLGIQLTYFTTISYSNAATATVLQFTSPVLVIGWLAIRQRRWPSKINTATVAVAVVGTFLLITQGHLSSLSISIAALVWGLLTAASDAVYILLPNKLLKEYGSVPVVAWSFVIGGIVMNVIHPVWVGFPAMTWPLFWILVFMVVPATTFAYLMELQSIPLLQATLVSILQAAEPIAATLIAVFLMGARFNWIGVMGIVMVISTVFIQALPQRRTT